MSELYLRGDRALAALCEQATAEGRLGLDTEFHRERRYFPQLALLQLAVGDRRVLVDPLEAIDLAPLADVLGDPGVVKVLHAPAQDLEIFYFRFGQTARNVFDTQTAAALLGLGGQISLGGLVEKVLGVRLAKGQSFTDWLQRPLTSKQEHYALEDVEHLFGLHDELSRRLDELGRTEWMAQECEGFERTELYDPPADGLYKKVKRFRSLDPRGLAVLRELAAWRDRTAREIDRNRRAIAGDEVLVELAKAKPRAMKQLSRTRGLHPKTSERHGQNILAAIAAGQDVPDADCPTVADRVPLNEASGLAASLAYAFLKACAQEAAIDVSMLATVSQVEKLASDYLDGCLETDRVDLLSGWRGELAGNRLMAFLQGEIAVRLDPESGSPVFEPALQN